jgi:hypothetical protein
LVFFSGPTARSYLSPLDRPIWKAFTMGLQLRWLWHDNMGLQETVEQSGIRQKYEKIEAARSAANTCLRKVFPE